MNGNQRSGSEGGDGGDERPPKRRRNQEEEDDEEMKTIKELAEVERRLEELRRENLRLLLAHLQVRNK